jgi:hypothetical protein
MDTFGGGWCGVTQVFISYATPDRTIVGEVSSWLRAAGHEPFLDHDFRDGIGVGEDGRQCLYHELREDGVGARLPFRMEENNQDVMSQRLEEVTLPRRSKNRTCSTSRGLDHVLRLLTVAGSQNLGSLGSSGRSDRQLI